MAAVAAIFGAIWRVLDGLRRFLHLLLLLIIFGIVIGALRGSIPSIPSRAALVIAPQGELVEQFSGDPVERALERTQDRRQERARLA